ncbi:hypothetical protein SAMN02910298_02588 [Pseudobutyrivibrio sp. YE44]|uniref:hypothetical protein n=1 Tax=Pseudobutyrivibrio sp. YE44 TaxID=1520802 RepID=UPI00088E9E92|nr:hypothetical protein [Pseudobutyrivibrio sp. YE44]SDB50810.1 hypothetical protein SAMN02910298_02588 [Pseudobutyrivibrio sp. YE44]
MKGKQVVAGLVLILFAVALFMDKLGVFPELPIIKIGMSAILVYVIACSLRKLQFVGITFPLGLIACLFSTELGIDKVSPAIIILVSVLVGIGLTLIFGHHPAVKVIGGKESHNWNKHCGGNSTVEYSEAEGTFCVDNNLGERTEYVTVKNLRRGDIDNALGSLTVYLNGSTLDPAGAFISIDNGLGSLKVFIPKEFRVKMNIDNGLGAINTHGEYSHDEASPLLSLDIDNGLGQTDIYFE